MADELLKMADQFQGLPMSDLIGAPLRAACDAQVMLANATATFIKVVGFEPPPTPPPPAGGGTTDPNLTGATRTAKFSFTRPKVSGDPKNTETEKVELDVPLLAIVNVPSLLVKRVDVTFDMEVKSSYKEAETNDMVAKGSADVRFGWGPFSAKVHIEGSVSSHKEKTRESDNSAKYHVEVHAEDTGVPEGLARVLDILNSAVVPVVTTLPPSSNANPPASDPNQPVHR